MTKEDLKKYDFIVLIDKSGSMSTPDCPGGKSRWQYAQEETLAICAKASEYDQNGATVGFFAGNFKLYENITGAVEQVQKIFDENEPSGSTDTAKVVKHVLDEYIASRKGETAKPIIVVVVTDGRPDDEAALAKVIVDATQQIEADEEIGILFLQIGKDEHATAFLKKLDDDLGPLGAKFDIVDTKTMEEMENITISEAFEQAILD